MEDIKKIKIIRTKISYLFSNQLLKAISNQINIKKNKKKISFYITVNAVHGVSESTFNTKLKNSINRSNIALPDGRPIYWALKLLGKNTQHLPGYFVTEKILKLAKEKNFKIGIYGSTNDTQKKFITKIKKRYGPLKISYIYSPPFRSLKLKEKKRIQKKINRSKTDILFVALGAPKQEIWMYNNYKDLNCILIGIGAAIDFISGNKNLPPKFMEHFGLAWLYRLLSEPKRLFLRYLITNSIFLFFFTIQYIKFKFK